MEKDVSQKLFNTAVSDGDVDTIMTLIRSRAIAVNQRDITHDLETPLMRLCHADLGQPDAVNFILEIFEDKLPDLNQQDALGRTLAMHACIAHNTAMLEFVIAHECDIMVADRHGKNLVHYAACTGSDAIVELALRHPEAAQAIRTLDFQGYSPVDLAKQRKFSSVVRTLTSFLQTSKSRSYSATTKTPASPAIRSEGQVQPLTHPKKFAHRQDGQIHQDQHEPAGDNSPTKLKSLNPLIHREHQSHLADLPDTLRSETPGKASHRISDTKEVVLTSPQMLQPPTIKHRLHHSLQCGETNLRQQTMPLSKRINFHEMGLKEKENGMHNEGSKISDNSAFPVNKSPDLWDDSHHEPHQNRKSETAVPLPPCIGPNTKSPAKRHPPWCQKEVLKDQDSNPKYASDQNNTPNNANGLHVSHDKGIHTLRQKEHSDASSSSGNLLHKSRPCLNPKLEISKTMAALVDGRVYSGPDLSSNNSSEETMNTSSSELAAFLSPRPRPRHNQNHTLLQRRHDRDDGVFTTDNQAVRSSLTPDSGKKYEHTQPLKVQQPHQTNHKIDSKQHGAKLEGQTVKDNDSRLCHRRPSLSLPDLRDMTGCLVTSHETSVLHQLLYANSRKNYSDQPRGNSSRNKDRGEHGGDNDDDDGDDNEDELDDNAEIEGDSDSSLVDSCFEDEALSPGNHSNINSARVYDKTLPKLCTKKMEKN